MGGIGTTDFHIKMTDCRCDEDIMGCGETLSNHLMSAVASAGLTALNSCYWDFVYGGCTASVILAESHIVVHTWPELNNTVLVDISVCHYQGDNSGKAHTLRRYIEALFNPKAPIDMKVAGWV